MTPRGPVGYLAKSESVSHSRFSHRPKSFAPHMTIYGIILWEKLGTYRVFLRRSTGIVVTTSYAASQSLG